MQESEEMTGPNDVEYPFLVSAPGKVIVFGEHSVVHGKDALAAAISLRSYLLVSRKPQDDRTITLEFLDIRLSHTWSIDDLPWDEFRKPGLVEGWPQAVHLLDEENVSSIAPHLETVSEDTPLELRKVHRSAAFAFLYVFMSHASPGFPSCIYEMRSTIPIGSGLGSSASVSVCISAALLTQARSIRPPGKYRSGDTTEAILRIVNEWAFVGELCIHGNPSGVDNTVATHGKAVLFRRVSKDKPPKVTPIHTFPQLPLLITDTQQSRSTATEVKKVQNLLSSQPVVGSIILDAMDQTTKAAHKMMLDEAFDLQSCEAVRKLGELFRINHGLLVSLGVSHPRIERVGQLVDKSELGWTKLTGAGGGGCVITLLPPNADDEALSALNETLDKEGYLRYRTLLGVKGLGIMVEADMVPLEKFRSIPGADGLENLVGSTSKTACHKWLYWDS